jgi:hypothetical protein
MVKHVYSGRVRRCKDAFPSLHSSGMVSRFEIKKFGRTTVCTID